MANFCEKCGAPLNGEKFCPNCGAPVAAAPAAPAAAPAPAAPQAPQTADAKDASDNKVMAILAYLGILVLVPLFAAKDSKFAKFHTNQGLTLAIAGVVLFLLNMLISWATTTTKYIWGIPYPDHSWVYYIWAIIYWVACIFLLVLCIMGIINAAKGECKELPITGKFQLLK